MVPKRGITGASGNPPGWLRAVVLGAALTARSLTGGDALVNLAPLATLSCEPAPDGNCLAAVNDGDPVSSLVFAVRSKGEGQVALRFGQPQTIARVRVRQGERAYYSTAYRLTADADDDGVYEKTLATAPDKVAWGDWVSYDFAPVKVHGVRFESLAGFSEGLRAHPVLHEIEIYGEATANVLKELMKTNTQPTAVPTLKPLFLETPLATAGTAAVIVLVPCGDGWQALGERIGRAIVKAGGAAPRVTDVPADADPARVTVVALGQMLNNPVIERLYWNHYTYTDSLWPGRDGCVVQTVHNPYPWTAGHNVVVLGGSSLAGVRRAVEEFERLLGATRGGTLGPTYRVVLPPPGQRETDHNIGSEVYASIRLPAQDLTAEPAKALIEAEPNRSLLTFYELATRYLLTGELPYLQAAKRVLDAMADVYERDPHHEPTWPEETNSRYVFATWDTIEEHPLFSDTDRLRYTNMLLHFLYSLVGKTSDYGNLEKNDTIVWNHTTFPLMGLYWGGRYFRRGYDCVYMDTYLRKAEGAFRGQEKSWKPQCDADSYLVLTMGHTIDYALAEGRMTFFENGNIRRYADYLMGIGDNRGWAAGFGDSGIQKNTSVPDAGVPIAFWYTKDPRYLGYLNAIHQGHWPNPYHQDVTPAPPDHIVGVRVYPLDRQVYAYTAKRSYYGEPSGPPNIPFAQAFDKIAFRENLDPLGQYFVLDGYARGKHLHYDGNAILKLTDKGEDWLVDGDYLVRNTTEHTMVSIIRDGRAARLVPECAAHLAAADLSRHGLVHTMVKDYNGADWHRYVFWQKGGWIVLLDRLVAAEPGDYTFDCVFKCTDQGGETLVAPDRFRITRGGIGRMGTHRLDRAGPTEGDGQAVAFNRHDAQFQFGARLDSGQYRVTLTAKGPDSSSDSLWVRLDQEEQVAFHLPVGQLGPSSATPAKTDPSPTLAVAASGEHTFTITLREGPGPVLQSILIESLAPGGTRLAIPAASAPPARQPPPVRQRSFSIVNADGAAQSVAARIGSSGPIKCLFQRRTGPLARGAESTFQNLLYLDDLGEQKNFRIAPFARNAVLARVEEPTLLGTGELTVQDLHVDADMFLVSETRLCLAGGTFFAAGGTTLHASAPATLDLDLSTGKGTLSASPPATVTVRTPQGVTEWAGGTAPTAMQLPAVASLSAAIRTRLAAPPGTNPVATAQPATGFRPLPELRLAWGDNDSPEAPEIRDVTSAVLRQGDAPVTLACVGPELRCYTADGHVAWRFAAAKRLRCVTVADVNADGKPEVLCGGDDETVHVLDADGKELASHRMVERLIVGQGGTVMPCVNCLKVDDLDGDGTMEVIVGCSNSQLSVFNPAFERLWNNGGVYHGVRRLDTASLGDPGKRQILAADHYGSVHIFAADGKARASAYSELGDVAFDVGDIDGTGKLAVVNGSSSGTLTAYKYPVEQIFSFNNYGYGVRAVRVLDLDGDGRAEVLVASDTGFLYALDGKGNPKWQRNLETALTALAAAPGTDGKPAGLVVGQRDGQVQVLGPDGAPRATYRLGAAVRLLRCEPRQGGQVRVYAVDSANRLVALEFGG